MLANKYFFWKSSRNPFIEEKDMFGRNRKIYLVFIDFFEYWMLVIDIYLRWIVWNIYLIFVNRWIHNKNEIFHRENMNIFIIKSWNLLILKNRNDSVLWNTLCKICGPCMILFVFFKILTFDNLSTIRCSKE